MCSSAFFNVIVPVLSASVPIFLFRVKFYSDARRNLDDRLLDLEYKLYDSDKRSSVYIDSFPDIRKAYHEYQRWMPFWHKQAFENAFANFRGSEISEEEIREGMANSSEEAEIALITNMELCCLPPSQNDYLEFMSRIDKLRRFTKSRKATKSRTKK